MERSILDTDTLSETLRGRDASVRRQSESYLSVFGRFTLSVLTVTEVVDGLRRQQLDAQIAQLSETLTAEGHEIVPLELESAKLAGLIFGDLHRIGQPIGRADPFIAAIAIQADALLVTGNTRHFERIQQLGYPLRLDNWRSVES